VVDNSTMQIGYMFVANGELSIAVLLEVKNEYK
jgi:hypothetical protein